MATIIKQNTPLVTQPLKTSPATGATLASMGLKKTIPLLHGSQGCGAFAKVYLIQHLREPIPLQNTAIDQVAAVMGGDENLFEALKTLCEKEAPQLITVMTTGLTEMQGTDTYRVIHDFRRQYPQYAATRIINMSTPDFSGSMQTGFASCVDAVVRQTVQPPSGRQKQRKQVNVLCSIGMTAADIETLQGYLEAFALDAIMVPDLSLSLDGHLDDSDYSACSTGGTSILEIELMADSCATLVLGRSLLPTATWLKQRFDIPLISLDMGMDIAQMDALVLALSQLSGKPVPDWIGRARRRLQDAMLDCHFVLSNEQIAVALEPDLAIGYGKLLASMGIRVPRIVTTVDAPGLAELSAAEVVIGDLASLNPVVAQVSTIISNSHAAGMFEPQVPVLRAGYPCHDQFGNMDIRQFGYEGCRERLFALANLQLRHHHDEVAPHISAYRFGADEVQPKERAS
ncbi:nitrogenase iron-molybdenum cofactor biosynthesis protein NifN [Shewanella yunxiaonensis]|uniref:Nitrogenase iron-molybdenum cofactor biosynthesis protein NifN n=1 Tax=Shewanella yunxiaonensis TaxID=2829809 RepID=A0ABX7YRD6_9GAMM|nr:nitrogenase iron-molybdenum cofactor biosynthesis protein NifN [Shewanella yunxiaonensis]QUN05343.1 nitrogenase iron-molybdenum cofactor biosynthesis protein NifN [Shewanella yunxiaonensis]